jgi:hypothetical protein
VQPLIALLGLPLALWLTATGLGLLAERLVRARLPDGLLAPLGFCVATSLLLAVYELHAGVAVAVCVLVAGTAAGLLLAHSELPARLNPGWPGLAGLAIYLLYAAPMLLTGNWTWSGYNFLNDTAVQFLLVDHLKSAGTDFLSLRQDTTAGYTTRAYIEGGYPLGTHAYAATLSGMLGSGPEVIYQAYLAAMAALSAMALAVLAGRTIFSVRAGALVGAVAMASNLTYNNGLQGSIKELGVIAALTAAAALARELVRAERPVALAALLGIALAAILSVYSAAGLPYVAALLATVALVLLLVHGREALRRRWLVAGAAAAVVGVVAAVPVLASISMFYRVASSVVDAAAPTGNTLGQLARPLPLLQAGGIWLAGNYTVPIYPAVHMEDATNAALWIVAALVLVSVVVVARRRCPEALLAVVPAALTAAVVAPGVVPYADAKLLAIMSPGLLFAAAVGLTGLARIVRPFGTALALALALALGGALVLSDAYALHDAKVAPRERMIALQDVMDEVAGDGVVLFTEFEEFAKSFARDAAVNISSEPVSPRLVELRTGSTALGLYFDLDRMKLGYVEQFRTIVLRRSPSESRPPARYRHVYANRYYEVWKASARPKTLHHLPLQGANDATAPADCDAVRALVRRAPTRVAGVELVAATVPPAARLDPLQADHPPQLAPDQGIPGTMTTLSPTSVRGRVRIPRDGAYRLWLRGTFPRVTEILVDGERRATVHGSDTPGQWAGDVALRLTGGAHRVEVRVPKGALRAGDGAAVTIGPLAIIADEPARLERVALARWRSLCGRKLDWIELVRRGD